MPSARELDFLRRHRAHDYRAVVEAWRVIAADADAEISVFAADSGFPILSILRQGNPDRPGLYLSAGIHGDEPAAVWGIIAWASTRLAKQRRTVLIFPCLNPWGLVHNQRHDQRGRDLNRAFAPPMPPIFRRWERVLERDAPPGHFSHAVCLHEDFDARGSYCYSLRRRNRPTPARDALDAACAVIPADPRRRIEDRPAHHGLIERTSLPDLAGEPEAFSLYRNWAWNVLTYESPSEFSFHARVCAQRAFIRAVEAAPDA